MITYTMELGLSRPASSSTGDRMRSKEKNIYASVCGKICVQQIVFHLAINFPLENGGKVTPL